MALSTEKESSKEEQIYWLKVGAYKEVGMYKQTNWLYL